jgi:hypothetical protein
MAKPAPMRGRKMKDGQIVWQCQCQHCGWKGSMTTDVTRSHEEARQHLAEAHPPAAGASDAATRGGDSGEGDAGTKPDAATRGGTSDPVAVSPRPRVPASPSPPASPRPRVPVSPSMSVPFLADLIRLTLDVSPFPHPERALPLLLGTAAQESGLVSLRQLGGGPGRGMFSCEPATERDMWTYLRAHKPLLWLFETRAGVHGPDPRHLECNVVYGILLARLHYVVRDRNALPEAQDLPAQAATWKRVYNTAQGKGTAAQYIATYTRLIAPHFPLEQCIVVRGELGSGSALSTSPLATRHSPEEGSA